MVATMRAPLPARRATSSKMRVSESLASWPPTIRSEPFGAQGATSLLEPARFVAGRLVAFLGIQHDLSVTGTEETGCNADRPVANDGTAICEHVPDFERAFVQDEEVRIRARCEASFVAESQH